MLRTLNIPYPSVADAEMVRKVLTVDRELKPQDVRKVWQVIPASSTSSLQSQSQPLPGAELRITIHANTVRTMRLNVNSVLEDVALVTRSIEAFDPQRMQNTANEGLELGSVGRAG